MNPALIERLTQINAALRDARHGERGAILGAACTELGVGRATLHRKLKEIALTPPRKRRADCGQTALSREEAKLISAAIMAATRKNGKRLSRIADVVEMLRANGKIRAERVDEATGEVIALSETTIARALRQYGLHPDQLNQPDPVTELASKHPNHVWQIDASICVLYWLNRANVGLQVMGADEFYKNKPANLKRIEQDRVWRYVITDHYSGTIFVHYVFGGETAQNLTEVFIRAVVQRAGDPFHGVPWAVMLDPGSANTSAIFKNLCLALQVTVIINKPKNPRAKGQVEKAQDIVERKFESRLSFAHVANIEQLNALATRWMLHFNSTAIHSRHKHARYGLWQRIRPEELRIAPPAECLRQLAVSAPENRNVTPKLRVKWGGDQYDVSQVPDVMVGEKLSLVLNPWQPDTLSAVRINEEGRSMYYVCPKIELSEAGWSSDAALITEEYKQHAYTPTQKSRQEIEQLVTGTNSAGEALKARKNKTLPFKGEIDPFKTLETPVPSFMARRGTAHPVEGNNFVSPKLNHVEAAKLLKPLLAQAGHEWSAARYQWLIEHYPGGVPQEMLLAIVAEMTKPADVIRLAI